MRSNRTSIRLSMALASLVMFAQAGAAQAAPPHAIQPLPIDTQFNFTGQIVQNTAIARISPPLLRHNAMAMAISGNGPAAATPAPTDPYVLPTIKALPFNEQAIEATLNHLFSNWPDAKTKYSGFFEMMSRVIDIKSDALSSTAVQNAPTGTNVTIPEWNLPAFPDVGITVQKPSAIAPLDPFKISQPAASTSGPGDAIFVVIDGTGAPVPVAVAKLIEADFIRGLVTRLVLDAYKSAGSKYSGAAGLATVSLALGTISIDPKQFQNYVLPVNYPSYPTTGPITGSTYQDDLAKLTQNNPVAPIALLMGWNAASQLLQDDAGGANGLEKDVWTLLSYRYSFKDFGVMTGYTLNYLAGYAENTRIVNIATASPPGQLLDAGSIAVAAGKDTAVSAAKHLVVNFGNFLTAEFYAISQNPKLSLTLRTRESNFIDGYRKGVSESVNDIYALIANSAYGIGYNDGFTDGYSVGYAAGWRDGYAAGNAAAWQAAQVIINNLQSQIGTLQNQLSNADSGGGFWDSVGSILGDAGTAIGIIGSFF